MSISKIKFNNNQEAFFVLDSIDEIDKAEFKTFLNMTSPYFLKCEFDGDKTFNLYYNYGERLVLKKFISQNLNKHEMLAFLKSLVCVFIEAEEQGLNPEHIDLAVNSVFYDPSTEVVSCIYLPTNEGVFRSKPLRLFVKEVLVNVLYDETDDMRWLGNTIRYIGHHRELSFKEFYEFLDNEDMNEDTVLPNIVQEDAVNQEVDAPVEEANSKAVEPEEQETVKEMPVEADEEDVIENIPTAEPVAALKEEEPTPYVTDTKEQGPFIVTPVIDDDDEEDEVFESHAFLFRKADRETYPLNTGKSTIGKALDNTVVITGNPAISRTHACILCEEDTFYIRDNHSTNHTLVNGILVEEGQKKRLSAGDRILLGNEELIFKVDAE